MEVAKAAPRGRSAQVRAIPLELLAVLPAVLGATGFYMSRFRALFPLIEFRSWLEYPTIGVSALLRGMIVRDQLFTRSFSLEFAKATGALCGINVPCLNELSYVPIPLTVVLLFGLLRQLGSPCVAAGTAAFCWSFSEPVAEAMSWQATIHDKLATVFAVAALSLAVHFVHRPVTWKAALASNGALLVLLMLAYNSKEAAFFLAPSLVLLPLARARGRTFRDVVRPLALLAAPLAYAAYHNVRYLASIRLDPAWLAHTGGGDPSSHARRLLPHLLSSTDLTPGLAAAFVGLACVVALALALEVRRVLRGEHAWSARYEELVDARTSLWLWATFFIAATIDLRTEYVSTYSLMAPAALFFAATSLSFVLLMRHLPLHGRDTASAVVVLACVSGLLTNFAKSFERLQDQADRSRAFQESFASFRRFIPETHIGPIYLVNDDLSYYAFWFTGKSASRDIYPYIYRTLLSSPRFEQQFIDVRTSQWRSLAPLDPRALYAIFDRDMRLVRVDEGARVLFLDAARARTAGVAP